MLEEQRQSVRRPLKVKAMLAMEGQPAAQARAMDIGNNGMSLTMAAPVQSGLAGQIKFDLFFDGKATPITARVKVAYCIFGGGEFKVGLTFVNLELSAMTVISKYLK